MEKIECTLISGKKYFVFISSYIVLGTLLSTAVAWKYHQFLFVWIGIIVFWAFPVIFQNQFQRPFSKAAVFNFSADHLQIQTFSKNRSEEQCEIAFSEIASFRAIESFKDDSAYLKIFLRNGNSFKYNLIGQKNKGKGNVLASIFSYFKDYNNSKSLGQTKITIRPSFFTTRLGKSLIWGLSILLVSSLIIQIILLPQSIPASMLTGLAFFIIILHQKRRDVQLNKRLIE